MAVDEFFLSQTHFDAIPDAAHRGRVKAWLTVGTKLPFETHNDIIDEVYKTATALVHKHGAGSMENHQAACVSVTAALANVLTSIYEWGHPRYTLKDGITPDDPDQWDYFKVPADFAKCLIEAYGCHRLKMKAIAEGEGSRA